MDINEEELKKKLTTEQYKVLREKGTERPFTGKYLDSHEKGMFACVVCGNQLFSSDTKFDSGTGWPSFDQALPASVKLERDAAYGMDRTEVLCANCGSHLGHVFDDGPRPAGGGQAGKRYCINSVCLDLKKKEQ